MLDAIKDNKGLVALVMLVLGFTLQQVISGWLKEIENTRAMLIQVQMLIKDLEKEDSESESRLQLEFQKAVQDLDKRLKIIEVQTFTK